MQIEDEMILDNKSKKRAETVSTYFISFLNALCSNRSKLKEKVTEKKKRKEETILREEMNGCERSNTRKGEEE